MDRVGDNNTAVIGSDTALLGDSSAGGLSSSSSQGKGCDFNNIDTMDIERQFGDTKALGSEGCSAYDSVKRSMASVVTLAQSTSP